MNPFILYLTFTGRKKPTKDEHTKNTLTAENRKLNEMIFLTATITSKDIIINEQHHSTHCNKHSHPKNLLKLEKCIMME